jgi:hypothetical protein
MDQDESERQSRVPSHLKPFLRAAITTEPVLTQDNAIGIEISPPKPVELCPPHWRLESKRGIGSTLKSLILKEWPLPKPRTPPRSISTERPGIMRMKDSDDYITARAANPRTGLISPSVGTLTPRLQDMPDPPGEALCIKPKVLPSSPTPEAKERLVLKRANEDRKISAGCKKSWRPDVNGWLMEAPVTSASPRFTDAQVEGDIVAWGGQHPAGDDVLVVHMPSAREPQPYAYPGYSAKQIEAVEFYKRKARQVSREGYDKRILSGSRQCSADSKTSDGGGIRKVPSQKRSQKPVTTNDLYIREAESSVHHGGHIIVAKRRIGCHEFKDLEIEEDCRDGAELLKRTFAPFESPKTPGLRTQDGSAKEMHTSKPLRQRGASDIHQIHRKPVSRLPESLYHTVNLKSRPQIAMVHPTSAALPHNHSHRHQVPQDGDRRCSFGCAKDPDSDVCIERRTPSSSTISSSPRPLFDRRPSNRTMNEPTKDNQIVARDHQDTVPLMEHLAAAVISIIDAFRYLIAPIVPRLAVIDYLRAEQTPQQKLDAMKRMLSTSGQALVLLVLAATLWHVGSAVVRVFEVVFWPMVLPFRILGWMGGGTG